MVLTNWLAQAHSLEELKTLYRQLAREHHPDLGGSTFVMQEINTEYDLRYKFFLSDYAPKPRVSSEPAKRPPNSHKERSSNPPKTEWERLKISQEAYEAYQAVGQLRSQAPYSGGLSVEINQGKVRVHGKATYHYRNQLKALGFYWDSNKRYWYFARKPRIKTNPATKKAS